MSCRSSSRIVSASAIAVSIAALSVFGCASVPIPTADCADTTCTSADDCNNRAASALARGEADVARCYAAVALIVNPADAEAHLGSGIASAIIGKRQEAERQLKLVVAPATTANQTQITVARQWLAAMARPLPVLIAYTPAPECTPDADAFTGRALATVFERMGALRPIQHQPVIWDPAAFDVARAGSASQIVHVSLRCLAIDRVPYEGRLIWNGVVYRSTIRLLVETYDVQSRERTAQFMERSDASHAVQFLSVNTAMAKGMARIVYRLSHQLLMGE